MTLYQIILNVDTAILSFYHTLAEIAGGILTPVMSLITLIGEKGILMFFLAAMLMLFPKTRRAGVCIFGAVCCGALITNIILKDTVARIRPMDADALFREWWGFVGAPSEDGFSFPSGHVTAATAGMLAICLTRGKKWIAPAAAYIVLMGASRNYLMAHYPSDVLAAIFVGAFSATVAYFISKYIFMFLESHRDNGFCKFVLDFEPIKLKKS